MINGKFPESWMGAYFNENFALVNCTYAHVQQLQLFPAYNICIAKSKEVLRTTNMDANHYLIIVPMINGKIPGRYDAFVSSIVESIITMPSPETLLSKGQISLVIKFFLYTKLIDDFNHL